MDRAKLMISILSWNVCGIGDRDKCDSVRLAYPRLPPFVICLQETKLSGINHFKAATFLPGMHSASFSSLNSDGASSGILTAWNTSVLVLLDSTPRQYTLTTSFMLPASGLYLTITNCYGPCHQRRSQPKILGGAGRQWAAGGARQTGTAGGFPAAGGARQAVPGGRRGAAGGSRRLAGAAAPPCGMGGSATAYNPYLDQVGQ